MTSQNFTQQHFSSLFETLQSVLATDRNARSLTLHEGMEATALCLKNVGATGKKIIFVGNGGSAGIASHQAIDYWKNGGIRATAFNDASLLTCISNDYGYEHVFAKPIEMFAEPGDAVIAISSSGQSANILAACTASRLRGCSLITLSGFKEDNPLRRLGDINLYVPSHSYGFVEVLHLALSHCVLDGLMAKELGTST